jgi:hypothetical protein
MRGNMGDVHLKETATSRRISPFVILPLEIKNENRLDLVILHIRQWFWKKKVLQCYFPTPSTECPPFP